MHIVEAFEEALENQNTAQMKLNNLAIELMQKKDPESMELALKIKELGEQVGGILKPLTH